jgi:hypothetical protein
MSRRVAAKAMEESELPQQKTDRPKVEIFVFEPSPKGLVLVSPDFS